MNAAIVSGLVLLSHGFFLYAQSCGLASECGPLPPFGPGACGTGPGTAGDFDDPSGLMIASLDAHVEYDAAGPLAAGLQAVTTAMCYSRGMFAPCPEGRHTPLSLANTSDAVCSVLTCGGLEYTMPLLHISYMYSITHLWDQPGTAGSLPGEDPSGYYPGRTASGVLFFWSFLWPHVKLVLLHLFFYLRLHAPLRRNGNFWFAFFGKWSLADVLVMCAVLALFDLEVESSLVELWRALATDFTPLCDALCVLSMHNGTNISMIDVHNASAPLPPSNCSAACALARLAMDVGVTPTSLPHSKLGFVLRIEGRGAMYAFCVAVLISLGTGVWVEAMDDGLREALRRQRKATHRANFSGTMGDDAADNAAQADAVVADAAILAAMGPGGGEGGTRAAPSGGAGGLPMGPLPTGHAQLLSAYGDGGGLLLGGSCGGARPLLSVNDEAVEERTPWRVRHDARLQSAKGRYREQMLTAMHAALVLVQLVTIIGAFAMPSFERRVGGAISSLLAEAGIDFTSRVSLWSLPALTARGGSLDWLMACTFALFIVVAPVARSLTLLALLLLPLSLERARRLHVLSRRIVAFTALDVMLIATPLIGVAFGPMSEALFNPQTMPLCASIDTLYHTGQTCMRIDVVPAEGYWFNVAAIVMMLLSGFDGSPTSKFIHCRLYPTDSDPPPSLRCHEE